MTMTKENLIKLLLVMRDENWKLYKDFKAHRKSAMTNRCWGEYSGFDTVINLLTDPDYAQTIWDIYIPETETEKEAI